MSEVSIAYVGPKAVKRDTVTGTRLVFPQFQAIKVPAENAAILLRFDQVFVEADAVDEAIQRMAREQAKREQEAVEQQAQHDVQQAEQSMVVTINEKSVDLSKLACGRIATLIEAADLAIAPKEGKETAEQYKQRVRDALR
ncbi:hypothetical protein [Vibrio penaeicida]|uniref:hypothetical protein n=1 Tax=Vibrio penaeicida TaxID=104609 RepID=UPI000CE9DE3F|nr:hypothetical protein [Vibrio penaeicida]